MEIQVRPVGKYKDVTVKVDDATTTALGLHDDDEAKILAMDLLNGVIDLFPTRAEAVETIEEFLQQ